MNSSPETDKVALAFVAAQAALTNPHTDSRANTGKFSYAYLSLPALLEHVKPELQANGLGLMQDPGPDGVVTRITHTSGQFYEFGPLRLPAGQDAQSHGSAITYARRYAIAAALGLAADEDDDGKKASDAPPSPRRSQTAGPDSPETVPGPATTSTGGTPSSGLLGEGASSGTSGGELHRPCGGVYLPMVSRDGWVQCSKCSVQKKAHA